VSSLAFKTHQWTGFWFCRVLTLPQGFCLQNSYQTIMDHSVGKSVRELDCTHAALGLGFDVANSQDNPCLSLTTAEKLRALTGKSSKDAWAFLCPDFTTSIAVTHNQSGVYDLTGGVYLLSNSTRTALEMYTKAEDENRISLILRRLRLPPGISYPGLFQPGQPPTVLGGKERTILDRMWKIRGRATRFRGPSGGRLLRGGSTRIMYRRIGLLRQRGSDVYVWLRIHLRISL
jgi:hypothetical protein